MNGLRWKYTEAFLEMFVLSWLGLLKSHSVKLGALFTLCGRWAEGSRRMWLIELGW